MAQCSPNLHQGQGGSSAKGLFITNYAVATRRQIPAFRVNGFIFGAEPLVAQVYYFLGFPLSIFGSCPTHHGCCLLARFLSNFTLPCPFFDPSTALRKDCSQPRVQVSYNQGRMDVFCKFKTFKAFRRNLSCDTKSVSITIVQFHNLNLKVALKALHIGKIGHFTLSCAYLGPLVGYSPATMPLKGPKKGPGRVKLHRNHITGVWFSVAYSFLLSSRQMATV